MCYYIEIRELEGHEITHVLVCVEMAGFILAKGRRPFPEYGFCTQIPSLGPITPNFPWPSKNALYRKLIPEHEGGTFRPDLPNDVIVGDTLSFQH